MVVQDEALLVIKAHLVAESLLYEILEKLLPNATALEGARFSFPQLISVVESLRVHSSEQWIWASLRKLNVLRNEYAHRLTLDRLNQKREEFIRSTDTWISPPEGAEGLLRLQFVLVILCGQLANISHGEKTAGPGIV